MLKFLSPLLFLLCFTAAVYGQTDFNNYRPLRSNGAVPEDFAMDVLDIIDRDIELYEDLSEEYKKIDDFITETDLELNDFIHSGSVRFGDPVSKYLEELADSLLRDDPELRKKLRFYTMVSNEVNAFCSWQGIIFVSTGLLAELTSESQLALILGHEIAHYTEKHQLKRYELYNNEEENRNFVRMGKYSKEHESDADAIGLLRFHKNGYNAQDASKVFDMLLYSYLPFDEEPFDKSYFNTGDFIVPESEFPDKPQEISADGDYSDVGNSHPNIDKRREALQEGIDTLQNWGTDLFKLGEERFKEVNNIAKFESIRCGLLDRNFEQALYELFVLEKEFPESVYLKQMKAQAWIGILGQKEGSSYYDGEYNDYDFGGKTEGEMSVLSGYINSLNFEAAQTIALRTIYNLRKEMPENAEMDSCLQYLLDILVSENGVKFENYSKKSFSQAANDFLNLQKEKAEKEAADKQLKKLTKLEKIKIQRSSDRPENFDSTLYYRYGMADIIGDSSFMSRYHKHKEDKQVSDLAMEDWEAMTPDERDSVDQAKTDSIIQHIIILDPQVRVSSSFYDELYREEEIELRAAEAIRNAMFHLDVESIRMDSRVLTKLDQNDLHFRSLLLTLMDDYNNSEDFFLPVDHAELTELSKNHANDWVLFPRINYRFNSSGFWWGTIASTILFPTVSVFVPVYLNRNRQTRIELNLYNLKTHEIKTERTSFRHGIQSLELESEIRLMLKEMLDH
jgi:hypothetical protein